MDIKYIKSKEKDDTDMKVEFSGMIFIAGDTKEYFDEELTRLIDRYAI